MSSALGPQPPPDVMVNDRIWHPWVRLNRVIRAVLTTGWDSGQWPVVKVVLRRTMTERTKVAGAGWFN